MNPDFDTLDGLVIFLTELQLLQLKELWPVFLAIGYQVRVHNLGGQQAWGHCKVWIGEKCEGFPPVEVTSPTLKRLMEEHYHPAGDEEILSTFTLGGLTLNNQVEIEHFFIQHFRLVHQQHYKLSAMKLLQIAFNAGQFKAEYERGEYNEHLVKFYNENKLGEYETYAY